MDEYLLDILEQAGFTILATSSDDDPCLIIHIRCARSMFYIYAMPDNKYELLIANDKGQEVFESDTLLGCVVTMVNFVIDKLGRAKMNIVFRNLI